MSLAFGRLRALESQYEQAFRKARDFKFLNNSARKVLRDKLGIDPDVIDSAGSTNQDQASSAASTTPKGTTISVTAPDGSVHQFPDEVSANKFRQLAGIK
jgi:hypothetical protein